MARSPVSLSLLGPLLILVLGGCLESQESGDALKDPALGEKICLGAKAFGKDGNAYCLSEQDHRFHDLGEPAGARRKFIDVANDDTMVNATNFSRSVYVDCGMTGTLNERIADCSQKNGANAFWDGTLSAKVNYGTFTLISRSGVGVEVWRDDRTKLLWSAVFGLTEFAGGTSTWCQGAGLGAASSDPDGVCSDVSHQPNLSNPRSVCGEGEGRTSALKTENWETATYHVGKGGMGLNSSPVKVEWRLPSKEDIYQTRANGMVYAKFNAYTNIWTSSIVTERTAAHVIPDSTIYGWYMVLNNTSARLLSTNYWYRDGSSAFNPAVMCVGRVL